MTRQLKVASAFSVTPGPRYAHEGKFSGQSFRNDVLFPEFREAFNAGEKLCVDLDDVCGFGTSFLEESFGGLIRENGYTLSDLEKTLEYVSNDDPELIEEIKKYAKDAEYERLKR